MQTDPSPDGPRFLGKYEILARLDSGGMAEIFLARARGLAGFEKLVVLKRILPHLAAEEEFVSMFLDEAKTTVAMSHGNVVQVFDMGRGTGDEGNDYFIAMEYVAGKNLRRFLKKQIEKKLEPVDPPLAAWITSEILRGLDYAHRRTDSAGKPLGIVHRDLSPHNILISYEGEVKVADFGIAKAAGKVVHTETGLIRGKANYMSPEQARADVLDGRSDLFSVGTLLYEIVTGQLPFDGDSSDQILRNLLKGPPDPPSTLCHAVPKALDAIIMKALEQDPDRRYPTADLFLKDLGGYLGASGSVIGPRDLAASMTALFNEDIEEERKKLGTLPKAQAIAVATSAPPAPAERNSSSLRTKPVPEDQALGAWERLPRFARAGIAVAVIGLSAIGLRQVIGNSVATTPSPTPPPATSAPASPVETATPEPSPSPAKTHALPSPKASLVALATPIPIAIAAKGKLSVSSNPWSYVFVDGAPLLDGSGPISTINGKTLQSVPVQGVEMKSGRHKVRVEQWDASGAAVIAGETEVDVPASGDVKLFFKKDGDRFVVAAP